MDTKRVIARFETERQALALMDHPCIAQVYEAGETKSGRPYFAMEYAEGVPITTFCDGKRLRIHDRLLVFLQVCDAIQHAHQKGVIHRDIKPSNVLVATRDGTPSPKVIDFGIVKATTVSGTTETIGSTLVTREGGIIGTLAYMSPEQAIGSATVDTRSDIYSLGALLYELLTGAPPFDWERLREAPLPDAVQVIRDEDPPPLVARITESSEHETSQVADRRSIDLRRLLREVKGELQWITFRAIEKDPDRRYSSAAELAADIRRYLANEPVLAGPPSTIYRIQKYARRHRVRVTAAAFAFAGILAGGIAAGIAWDRASRALDRAVRAEHAARREAESARQVSDFLVELFQSSTPDRSGGETITAQTLLEQGTRRIQTSATGDAQIRARLLRTVGNAHMGLGLYDEGLQLLAEALATSESAQPPDEREIAEQLRVRAHGLLQAGKPDSVPILLDRALALLEKQGAPRSAVAVCLWEKASFVLNKGDMPQADSLLTIASEMTEAEPEPDKSLLLRITSTRAVLSHRRYELEDAEQHYLRMLELAQQVGEPTSTVLADRGLAWLYSSTGETEKAVKHGDQAVRLAQKLYGPDHPSLADALGGKAQALSVAGDDEQAIALHEEAASILRKKGIVDKLAHQLNTMGLLYRWVGKYELAIARTEEAHQIRNRIYGAENARTAETLANLARFYAEAGMEQRSEGCYREALPVLDRLNPKSTFTAWAYMGYGNLCRNMRRIAAADTAYLRAEAMLDSTNAGMQQYSGEVLIDHGYLRSIQGRHDEAESMIRSGFALQFGTDPKQEPALGRAHVLWAAAQANAGNMKGAMEHLRTAAQCGIKAPAVAKYSELASLRSRADYPWGKTP
jgi:non-specific serine/threonine protein kinase/serine/threonine-protein kinase